MIERTQDREKIAVFGGAFNPPTRAHQQIMEACLDQSDFAAVWVMPSGNRLDKTMATDDQERLDMLRVLKETDFADNDRLVISDYELKLPRPSETIRTVGALAIDFPDKDFWFVYGADSYCSMPSWPGGRELQTVLSVLLLPRIGTALPPPSARVAHLPDIKVNMGMISSTQVREAIMANQDISGMVSEPVRRFILKHAMYMG